MIYFVLIDNHDILYFGSCNNLEDDWGDVEIYGPQEIYIAKEEGVTIYDNANGGMVLGKSDIRTDEPPLSFDSMEKCVKHGYNMIINLMYEKPYLIETLFENDIKGWKGIMKYEI